ncbi:MAG: DUF11 domain-containing protein [Thiohalocapsa sp. PB-PSB1]|jgi:uncharacterized repeat protein (TIGR01451 family)|nr:MAG: hypothetical protein N838_22315 [Thiohalocapsa sp. PB-PSB1]QQO52454.1 MAG: DUF11 domain-containing protein [Thiohalocapsa sp. PB-PSB1]
MKNTHWLPPESKIMNRTHQVAGTAMTDAGRSTGTLLAGLFVFFCLALFQVQASAAPPAFGSVATAVETDKDVDSLTISRPSSTASGDFLLATIASKTDARSIQAPTGWTLIDEGEQAGNVTLTAYYKIAGGSEPAGYTFTQNADGEEMAGSIARYTGVDATNPVDTSGAQNGKGKTAGDDGPTAPCVTTSYDDTLVVRTFGQADGELSTSSLGGVTGRVDITSDDNVLLFVGDSTQALLGATGAEEFTVSQDKDWRGLTIALVPQGGIANNGESTVSFGSLQEATELDKDVDSVSLGKPIDTAEGDLLLASIAVVNDARNISAPSGWTEVNQGQRDGAVTLAVFYKLAGANEEGPYVFTTGLAGDEIAGSIERYTGVDQNTPIADSAGAGNKSETPTAPAADAATYTNTRVVRIFAQENSDFDTYAVVPCTVGRVALSADNAVILGVSDATQSASGSTGTGAFSTGADKDWRAVTVVLLPQQVELEIDKTTSTPTVDAGDQASYSVTVTNVGGATATDVEVSDQLPTGFTYASSSISSSGTVTRTSTVDPTVGTATPAWGLWNIDAGASLTIDYSADVAAGTVGGVYANSAATVSNETSEVLDTVDVTVQDADLAVTKTVDTPYPNEGDTVVFTVVATNNGDAAATNVSVVDTLPAGLTLVDAESTQGTCSGSGTITCAIGTLADNADATVTITATVDAELGDSALLENTASVSADQNDPDSGNDSATASAISCPVDNIHNVVILTQNEVDNDPSNNFDHLCTATEPAIDADLQVTKTADPASPVVGETLTYTLAVVNNGPDDATGVVVTDTLPAEVSFVSANATPGSCGQTGGVVTCSLGNVPALGTATITIVTTVVTAP